MIAADNNQFPMNVVMALKAELPLIDPSVATPVFHRPLMPTDPSQSLGIFLDTWTPDESSYEMLGGPDPRHKPSIERYAIGVHVLAKDTDAERGMAVHSEMCERVRARLYSSQTLHVALSSLAAVTSTGQIVRMMRWGVQDMKFLSGELQGYFYSLGNIRFYFEVENN